MALAGDVDGTAHRACPLPAATGPGSVVLALSPSAYASTPQSLVSPPKLSFGVPEAFRWGAVRGKGGI